MNLELNTCMGGLSEGLRRAGIEFTMGVDYDPNACDSHHRNIGWRPIQVDIRDLLRMARIRAFNPTLGFLCADPPCTPWSTAGDRKGLDDERDLLRETVELIQILRPGHWLIGNVPGLDKAENWAQVVQPVICAPLARAGSCIDFASMNAADYGTPQHRHRPWWFGHRKGTPCLQWPAPTHTGHDPIPGLGLKRHVSCMEALEEAFGPRDGWGLEVGRSVRLRRRAQNETDPKKKARAGKKPRASAPDAPTATVTAKQGHGGGSVLIDDGHHPWSEPDEPANVVRAGSGGGANRAMRLPDPNRPPADPSKPHRATGEIAAAGFADRPATVIGTRHELTSVGHHDPADPGSGNSGILLSEQALLVLQGFPKDWHVAGATKKARMSQIGQATPPQLAEAIGRSIVEWRQRTEQTRRTG